MKNFFTVITLLLINIFTLKAAPITPDLSDVAKSILSGKQILYTEREAYPKDHHNTATMFQKGEYNEKNYKYMAKGSAMRIFDVDTKEITTLIELEEGVVRDPELSFDGKKIIFSMRKNFDDDFHIYEINVDGSGLKQITSAVGVSDIDPLYLPDGGIVFSSTRQPKYCMCNRHIMCNLFRMNGDGSNITQIGVSTLFEGHSTLLPDGRILYDRWEYVDRNFANAQGLWAVNPDGTKHSIYYGNNTNYTDGVIDARPVPNSDLVACIFGDCHEAPFGALVIIDRKKGVDDLDPIIHIWPEDAMTLMTSQKNPEKTDKLRQSSASYEDPYPLSEQHILVARIMERTIAKGRAAGKSALYIVGTDGLEEMILEGSQGLYDPMIVEPRFKPSVMPEQRNYTDENGIFYVQNVYIGTHMEGVEQGSAKYLRVVESLEKRTYTMKGWFGQGEQAPGVSWHNFDIKRIVSEVEIEEDGSAHFEAPAGKHLYFQLLDKDKKMIQTMRSGVSLMPGETNGCIGCHEDRIDAPMPSSVFPTALKKAPAKINGWRGTKDTRGFGFMENVQPILDKHCLSCHDFDNDDRSKLVLAGDKNPYFNAAYINMYTRKVVNLIGGGPATFQAPYTWGSYASKLTKIIEGNHEGVELSTGEKQILYAWMDLNGGYYPVYESSFDNTLAGRSPMTLEETKELKELTGVEFDSKAKMLRYVRKIQAQVSFERPELSPCLDGIRTDTAKYNRAIELIKKGAERLEQTPRGDLEDELVVCDRLKEQLVRYTERMEGKNQNSWHIDISKKRYDE